MDFPSINLFSSHERSFLTCGEPNHDGRSIALSHSEHCERVPKTHWGKEMAKALVLKPSGVDLLQSLFPHDCILCSRSL